MAFPTSPTDGQIYQNYKYNATTGAWEASAHDSMSVGSIVPFSDGTVPTGWLPCDGRTISRTEYSELNSLYSAAGYPWGNGDGSTTFNIPDLRGVFPRGSGQHGSMTKADGTAFNGGNVGDETNDQMQQITGMADWGGFGPDQWGTTGAFVEGDPMSGGGASYSGNRSKFEFDSSQSTAQGGARTGDETRPASVTVSYIIKVRNTTSSDAEDINVDQRLGNLEGFLNTDPGVPNTVRVGSHEWQFTAGNELDYTSSITEDTTVTVSELPNNTVGIYIWIQMQDTSGYQAILPLKRNSSDVESYNIRIRAYGSSDLSYYTGQFIPTDGNSFRVTNPLIATCQLFRIYGFRTSASDFSPYTPSDQLWHYAQFEDRKTAGTDGGDFNSGAWRTRDLNTVVANEISGATLSGNQFTLPAGTYYIEASAPAYYVHRHMIRLQNMTDLATELWGTSVYAYDTVQNQSSIRGRFTISSSKTFEIQHKCDNTNSSDGFGIQCNSQLTVDHETYTQITIWKSS